MDKKQVLSGIRWTLITSILRRILTFVLFYFIARWLSKEDLGVFRTYSLILGFVAVTGILSLDYHYVIEERQKNVSLIALWQISIIAGVLCFFIITFGAGFLGSLYKSVMLGRTFQYASIFLIIEFLRRTVRSVATKRMQFKELAMAETYNVLFYSVVSIIALYFVRSVWVFLIVFYLGNLLETIYLWLVNRSLIQGKLHKHLTRKLLLCRVIKKHRSFISFATLVAIINQISGNAPILILGLLVKPDYLGIFYFASQLVGVPVGMFTAAINQVFFPVFAGTKDGDIGNMASRYLRLVGNLGLPLLLLFSVILMYLIGWLFGSKWDEAVSYVPLMFVLFGSSLYINPIGGIPFVKRKPSWELTWNIFAFVIRIGAMMLGLQTSFFMAILAFAAASAVTNIAFYLMSMHLIKIDLFASTKQVLISLIPTMMYAVFILLIRSLQPLAVLSLSLLGCGILLCAINLVSNGLLKADIKQLLS